MSGPLIAVKLDGIPLLIETTVTPGREQTSSGARIERMADALEQANAVIERMALSGARTAHRVIRKAGSPEQIEVQFGLKFSTQGSVILAGAGAEASLNVKVIYGRSPDVSELADDDADKLADRDGGEG